MSPRTAVPPPTVPARPAIRRALGELVACSPRFPITADRTADELHAAGWTRTDRLADPAAWPAIAQGYAADLGGAAVAVGGSCALQEYAGRTAGLVLGTWALTGAMLDLAAEGVWVDLRDGRTVGIAMPDARACGGAAEDDAPPEASDAPSDERSHTPSAAGPDDATATPERVAEALLAHLSPAVAASRTVSGLSSRVAWGNVAASVAGILGTLDRAQDPRDRPAWRAAATRVLAAPAWPHADLVAPVLLSAHDGDGRLPSDRGDHAEPVARDARNARDDALTHERATCCLIRLAPDHESCAACERLEPAERRERLRDDLRAAVAPRRRLRVVVGAAG
ncbi:ferric iron reductase [Patulibacter americanus]|uniref:ferric iron reductase n=1 Tax=Patulibacter americanus TaxID=588672 RepID=UPI00041397F2|nr:ferric iron reductase [Patulibacter americanus]